VSRNGLDTVLLDVDGTLIDSTYQHALAWHRAFGQHSLAIPMWRLHRAIGMDGDRLVPAVAGNGDDAEESKPAPDILQAALDQVGGQAAVCVGDSTYDVQAAAASGWQCLCVRTGGFGIAELYDAGAAHVFNDVAELLEKIDETPLARPG